MNITQLTIFILLAAVAMYFVACNKIGKVAAESNLKPTSLLSYYGLVAVIWVLIPALGLLLVYSFLGPIFIKLQFVKIIAATYPNYTESEINLAFAQIENIASGIIASNDIAMNQIAIDFKDWTEKSSFVRTWLVFIVSIISAIGILTALNPKIKARLFVEGFSRVIFFCAAALAILTTLAIIASLLMEAFRFFQVYNIFDFLFGTHWSPNMAIRDDQVGSSGSFGMIPVMAGTILIAIIAMVVAVPIGLFSAIYLAEFAPRRFRDIVKPALEILAGIPTVVYGFFAALMAAPFFRSIGQSLGFDVSSESALAAGAVMGIMIIPFISSLSDDVMNAVPQALRDGSIGLGATKGETITKVVLPAAIPGLVGAFLLAVSRAIGETMIVVMAAGTAANLTANPLDSVTTVTVQIVGLLTGDTVFDSPKTLSAFALGITLFTITLFLNVGALIISRRLAEKYD